MYKKMDLHVHTPESSCYVDHVMPEANIVTVPEMIVDAAVASGLHAIAITDHNSAEHIEEIREAATGEGLCVFPGIEISARGGHLLAIFDWNTPIEQLRRLLATLGFGEEDRGKGYLEPDFWIDQAALRVEESGGLAIAAHIDRRPKGFIASDLPIPDKMRIHNSDHFAALEITIPASRASWNGGLMPNFPKKYACVQGSDAHDPKEMGRRPIYFDISTVDLAGLRLAFREYETRIKFPEDITDGQR